VFIAGRRRKKHGHEAVVMVRELQPGERARVVVPGSACVGRVGRVIHLGASRKSADIDLGDIQLTV
jgi:hypothetical protein